MKLYHGTSQTALPSIRQHGLRPRGKRGPTNYKHTIESNPDCVYLTQGYSLYFAINAAKGIDGASILADLAIVEVDTDRVVPENLIPDEDAVEQTNRGKDALPKGWDMEKRTRWYRKRMPLYNDGQWQTSIEALGTCSHLGIVPVTALTRIARLDLRQNIALRFACDPTISLMNHQIMGHYYRALTAFIFGDEINWEELVAHDPFGHYKELFDTKLTRDGVTIEPIETLAMEETV